MTTEVERADACRKRAAALKRLAETFDNTNMRAEIMKLAEEWEAVAGRAERRARRPCAKRCSGEPAKTECHEYRVAGADEGARAKARH